MAFGARGGRGGPPGGRGRGAPRGGGGRGGGRGWSTLSWLFLWCHLSLYFLSSTKLHFRVALSRIIERERGKRKTFELQT
jgi:hypothetical protein